MKISRDEQEKLTQILRQAYQGKERLEVGMQWHNRAMAAIRQMGPVGSAASFLPTFEHLVWRLAPATSLLMVGLAALSVAMDVVYEYDLFQLFLNVIEDSALAHIFGV
jgi:hypothetical protein